MVRMHVARELIMFIASKHVKTHEKNFRCQFLNCSSTGFSTSRDQKRHERSCKKGFTVIKEYKCPYSNCKYVVEGFSRKDNCDRHIRRKHQSNAGDDAA